MDRPVRALQEEPDPRLAYLGIQAIVDHYAEIVSGLSKPPVLIGHSFGGLFVQLLLARGVGCAGVAIDPAAPFGIPVHPTALRTSLPVFLTLGGWSRILRMKWEEFASGFAQALPVSDIEVEYRSQVVPTPGRIFWQSVLGFGSRIRFSNPERPPLLIIAGEADRTVPLPTVRRNYRKQTAAASVTEFKAFSGRSHYLCNEPGWEEVADFALDWAKRIAPSLMRSV
jgi:pimeloyl-ACP methyl ester carboxylesterase